MWPWEWPECWEAIAFFCTSWSRLEHCDSILQILWIMCYVCSMHNSTVILNKAALTLKESSFAGRHRCFEFVGLALPVVWQFTLWHVGGGINHFCTFPRRCNSTLLTPGIRRCVTSTCKVALMEFRHVRSWKLNKLNRKSSWKVHVNQCWLLFSSNSVWSFPLLPHSEGFQVGGRISCRCI